MDLCLRLTPKAKIISIKCSKGSAELSKRHFSVWPHFSLFLCTLSSVKRGAVLFSRHKKVLNTCQRGTLAYCSFSNVKSWSYRYGTICLVVVSNTLQSTSLISGSRQARVYSMHSGAVAAILVK